MSQRDIQSMDARTSAVEEQIASLRVELAQNFSEFKSDQKHLKNDICNLAKQQEKLVYALHGNGREGLMTKVAKLSQRVGTIWAMIGTLGVGFLSFVVYYVRTLL